MTSGDDPRFVRRLRARDERAFEELVRAEQGAVFSACMHVLRNRAEAEDVAQDVFVTAFKRIDAFRGEATLRTWLRRIAVRQALNRLRYHRRRHYTQHDGIDGLVDPVDPAPRQDQQLAGQELADRLRIAFDSLTDEQRAILALRDMDLPYEDMAETLGIALGTVRSRLARARAALKQALDAMDGDPHEQ